MALFAVSILAGNVAALPVATLNAFAGFYLGSRVLYNVSDGFPLPDNITNSPFCASPAPLHQHDHRGPRESAQRDLRCRYASLKASSHLLRNELTLDIRRYCIHLHSLRQERQGARRSQALSLLLSSWGFSHELETRSENPETVRNNCCTYQTQNSKARFRDCQNLRSRTGAQVLKSSRLQYS